MDAQQWYNSLVNKIKDTLEYRFETFILDITENICRIMKEKNISRSKLAEKLNISKPAVTRMLDGNPNFTIKRLLTVADALDQELKIDFKEKEIVTSKPIDISLKPMYVSSNDISIPNTSTEDSLANSGSALFDYGLQPDKEIALAEAA